MTQAAKKVSFVFCCLVAVFVAFGYYFWYFRPARVVRRLDVGYHRVQKGMSSNEVFAIMGAPSRWKAEDFGVWWDEHKLTSAESARLRSAVTYEISTVLLTVTFEFTFDRNGVVVGRHRYH